MSSPFKKVVKLDRPEDAGYSQPGVEIDTFEHPLTDKFFLAVVRDGRRLGHLLTRAEVQELQTKLGEILEETK